MKLLFGMTSVLLMLAAAGCGGVVTERANAGSVQRGEEGGQVCLDKICGDDEYCCNPTCGVCAPIGGFCTDQVCHVEYCLNTICGPGEFCCNPSCGICAPIGGFCTDQVCHVEF
jgi:hypothetical protein